MLPFGQMSETISRQLSYEYTLRRRALDALKNLNSAFPERSQLLQQVDVLVSSEDKVVVSITLSSRATATDVAKAEGVFSGGRVISDSLPPINQSLRSYKEIYLGDGWRMFRAYSWRKGQDD